MGVGEEVQAGVGLGCVCREIFHFIGQDFNDSGGFAYGDHHSLVSGGEFGSDRVVARAYLWPPDAGGYTSINYLASFTRPSVRGRRKVADMPQPRHNPFP